MKILKIKLYNSVVFVFLRYMLKKQSKSEFSINPYLSVKGDNILLIWNRWYRNLGDELILLWNIKLLLKQWKKITIACYNPEWLRKFFVQFIDVNQISFIPELPKWFRSFFNYVFRYGMKWFTRFWKWDTIILWGGEILTEENPWAYWYWRMSIWPFLWKKRFQYLFKRKNKSDLYIMWWVQIPKNSKKKKQLLSLLKYTTSCYLRDFDAVNEIKPYMKGCEFFMDTSYFAYEWDKVSLNDENNIDKPYVVVNLNKNAESFFDDLVQDIKSYSKKWYRVYYVSVAKGNNIYYDDLQYAQCLEKELWEDVDFALLDWESDFDNFAKILKWAKKVFSSRLHLYLIASFLWCDTKVYPYQRKILKMKNVIEKFFDSSM